MKPAAIPRASTKLMSALLVDDDEFMLSVVGGMLQELGVTDVRTARDGQEGVRMFDKAALKPDVVLCDLNMPGTDGFQFMELIADRNFKGGVILVSGMDDRTRSSAALMARFHRLNVLGTISKPVSKSSLAEALAKAG